jgi:uncharacterized membrane protein YkvA (DUF1232 family)
MISKARKLLRTANTARLATYLIALWKLAKHPQVPRAPKWVALAVLAYALSPIDLIPDFIPVLGQLDDLVIVPAGIALVVRLTPAALWQACMREAEVSAERLPRLWWGLALVLFIWALLFVLLLWWLISLF